jgi:trigger factor
VKATWDKLEKNWMQFEVEVEAGQFTKSIDTAFRKLNQKVNIPGFRKGKAPRAIFERSYGKEVLVQEAVDQLLPQAYSDALAQGDIHPIDRPEVDLLQSEEGKAFIFKGKVQVLPEVALGRLAGFDLKPPSDEVTEAQVEEQIDKLRDRSAALTADESGEVKQGSFAVIDFEGFIGDEPFEGGKGENYSLEIGSNSFIPGFEDQLLGAKVGESRDVKVSFPEQYHAEHLAGKEALFKVTVKEVKTKELPQLTDEWAAEVSRFQTLQELRSDIENRLKESAKANAQREFQTQVLEAIAAEASVEIPGVLVSGKVHDMIHDFERTLAGQGYSLELWHQATGKSHEDLHKEFDEPAQKGVKNDLVIGAAAKQEGITVTEAEVEAEIDELVARYKGQEKEINKRRKDAAFRSQLREGLLVQKTIEHLINLNMAPQS